MGHIIHMGINVYSWPYILPMHSTTFFLAYLILRLKWTFLIRFVRCLAVVVVDDIVIVVVNF